MSLRITLTVKLRVWFYTVANVAEKWDIPIIPTAVLVLVPPGAIPTKEYLNYSRQGIALNVSLVRA